MRGSEKLGHASMSRPGMPLTTRQLWGGTRKDVPVFRGLLVSRVRDSQPKSPGTLVNQKFIDKVPALGRANCDRMFHAYLALQSVDSQDWQLEGRQAEGCPARSTFSMNF